MDLKELKDVRMPTTRIWVIIVIISVALVAALAIGLLVGGVAEHEILVHVDNCPSKSPLYKKPSTSREGHYSHAASAADSTLCSKLGSMLMELKGASAMDAAVSVSVCLGVTNPHHSGIGGGNFITYYKRDIKQMYTVIGREKAPSGVTADMFRDTAGTSASHTGGMSIGVPGEVSGLYEAWNLGRSGNIPWKKIIGPAIKLCTDGFYVGPSLLEAIRNTNLDEVPTTFKEFITNPETGEIYKEGDKMYQPKLAKTLKRIAEDPYTFYNGSLAGNITEDISEAGGILTMDDLTSYTAPVKPALKLNLRDNLSVYSPPLPSGGVVYQYILNILNGYDMDNTSVSTVDKALTTFHRTIEAFKHAFSLRSELGDTDVGPDATKEYINQLVRNMTNPSFGELTRELTNDLKTYEHEHYHQKYANSWDKGGSHFSVIGPNGDAVSITSTINLDFGSMVVGNRTGIVFNDQMDAFSTPGANNILPGKRPLSSMSPSIIVDGNGDVKLIIGASGGPKIITAMALVTMETLWFDWTIKEAIDFNRMHHLPYELGVEQGFPQVLIDGLKHRGHNVIVHPKASSVVQGIIRNGRQLSAISDYRKDGEAQGYI